MFEETPTFAKGSISYPNFLDWQRDNRSFEAMAAYRHTDGGITGVEEPESVQAERVSANFFPIVGVNPILGRNFTSEERVEIPLTIVGVVGHVNQWGLADDANSPLQAQMYRSVMQGSADGIKSLAPGFGIFVCSRTPLGSEAFFQAIRQRVLASNRDIIVSGNEIEENVVAQSIASQRFSLGVLGAFAGLALLLASIGIYGVLSYLVGQRTQEIGIRMALGTRRLDVLRMVLQDGARMTLAGTAIGIVAALGLTRLMASMLFGVKPTDPVTFGLVAVVLCGIALLAGYVPARRAAKLDPMVALRYE